MSSRDELLRGVVKVNDETRDKQTVEARIRSEVLAGGGGEASTSAPEPRRSPPRPAPAPALAEETVEEFLSRREREVLERLERTSSLIAKYELELFRMVNLRAGYEKELAQIKEMRSG